MIDLRPVHYLRSSSGTGPSRAKCGHPLEAHEDPKRWLPWTTDWDEVTCRNCKPKEFQQRTATQIKAAKHAKRFKRGERISLLVTPMNLAAYASTKDKLVLAMAIVDREFVEDFWTDDQREHWYEGGRRDRIACDLGQLVWAEVGDEVVLQ